MATERQIAELVASLGEGPTGSYSGRNPDVVPVLPDASISVSDLVRRIDTPLTEDAVGVAVDHGAIRITKDLLSDIEDRYLLLIAADATPLETLRILGHPHR